MFDEKVAADMTAGAAVFENGDREGRSARHAEEPDPNGTDRGGR